MTDEALQKRSSLLIQDAGTKRRNAAETRFKIYGLIAVLAGLLALVVLIGSIVSNGVSSFRQSFVALEVTLPEDKLDRSEEHTF